MTSTATPRSLVPAWEDFRSPPIFENLENVNAFDLTVELPKVLRMASRDQLFIVTDLIYAEVFKILKEAHFHARDRLTLVNSESQVGCSYDDDEFGFEVFIDSDGDLRITRQGSSFSRFHQWYVGLMPSVETLVSRIVDQLGQLAASKYTSTVLQAALQEDQSEGEEGLLKPLRVQFTYRFIAYDFMIAPAKTALPNYAVMKKLLGVLPRPDGSLRETKDDQESPEQFGRLDYRASRWTKDSGEAWGRQAYSIEAPGNRRFSTVWASFSYVGETKVDGASRSEFDATNFLKRYQVPYVEFLRERALDNFLGNLTAGMTFQTATGRLP
ncbi:hypothetical protein ACW4TU_41220 [Streptomyces sp. QTS52]